MTIIAKETQPLISKKRLPYQVTVVSMNHFGIVHNISAFLSNRNLNFEEKETKTYSAAHTDTPMFSLGMTISISADSSVCVLRNEFLDLCDDFNLEASMESKRLTSIILGYFSQFFPIRPSNRVQSVYA